MTPAQMRRAAAGAGVALGMGATTIYAIQAVRYRRSVGRRFDLADAPQPGTPEFARLLEALTSAAPRSGNRVRAMRNGRTLVEMREAILSAKTTIDFSSYIYWPGEAAEGFTQELVERASAGVVVIMVVDAYETV